MTEVHDIMEDDDSPTRFDSVAWTDQPCAPYSRLLRFAFLHEQCGVLCWLALRAVCFPLQLPFEISDQYPCVPTLACKNAAVYAQPTAQSVK